MRFDDGEPAVQPFRLLLSGQWQIAFLECICQALDSDVVDAKDGLQLCLVLLKRRVVNCIIPWWRNIL